MYQINFLGFFLVICKLSVPSALAMGPTLPDFHTLEWDTDQVKIAWTDRSSNTAAFELLRAKNSIEKWTTVKVNGLNVNGVRVYNSRFVTRTFDGWVGDEIVVLDTDIGKGSYHYKILIYEVIGNALHVKETDHQTLGIPQGPPIALRNENKFLIGSNFQSFFNPVF